MTFLSFSLPETDLEPYKTKRPNWGFDIGQGNSLSELTFIAKYSRLKDDGTKERWWEVCRRCIEGQYSILKDHCRTNRTPWNEYKAQRSAMDAYERMFSFKWLPPGRGLWMMGTAFVHENNNSAALQNCAFISTEKLTTHSAHDATLPFVRLMEMSMLGVGVGFDTRGAGKLTWQKPNEEEETFIIPDTREGWCDSVQILLESFFFKNRATVRFDYSLVRAAGEPIKGFGGVAAGPEPLRALHEKLRQIANDSTGESVSSVDIVDICNLVGKCVVSGNVRRSALIALGDADDSDFLNLKNPEVYPERNGADGWSWTSNNSVIANVNEDYSHLVDNITLNGEPGLFFLDLARKYGRMVDPIDNKDAKIKGCNPCAEQPLEHMEMCTLVETFPHNHDHSDDFAQTLKHAYLYGKAVTLMPTHWPETNEVMQRNRRIGCSVSGLAEFVEARGWNELRIWLDKGYQVVHERDVKYSAWLGVRESIKKTTVKPSGTVGLVAGTTAGAHWPVEVVYIRTMRFSNIDPMLKILTDAGYPSEPDQANPTTTSVVSFPTTGPKIRTELEVSIWEKAELAVLLQRWWSDNMVSCTLNFKSEEQDQIAALIAAKTGQLKSMSMLPIDTDVYPQMPYQAISEEQLVKLRSGVKAIDWEAAYNTGLEAEGEKYCATDKCELPV